MGKRTDLQSILETLLNSKNVYYQPPPTYKMKYPCIVYELNSGDTQFADNLPYVFKKRYTVTLISRRSDIEAFEKIAMLPMCTYDRHYTADNLNHDVFNLYF